MEHSDQQYASAQPNQHIRDWLSLANDAVKATDSLLRYTSKHLPSTPAASKIQGSYRDNGSENF